MNLREYVRYLARAIKYRIRLNRAELSLLGRWLRRGDTAIDVGAHKGGMLFWLRRKVGPAGRVIAIEPQPALARYLGDIVRGMGWKNVSVEHAAAGEAPGHATLFVPGRPGATSAAASLIRKDGVEQQAIEVPVLDLDGYLERAGVGRVTFLKVDCEGNELEVFRGAEALLRRDHPVLLFECERRHLRTGRRPADVFAFLLKLGYRGWFLLEGRLEPVERFSVDVHQKTGEGHFWGAPGYVSNFVFDWNGDANPGT